MKIVTLIENTACRDDLAAEHGLSLYIETGRHRILFDAGQTAAFADNAEKLGIDLGSITFAVLSHGHYDHGGGLARFLEINSQAPIYLSRHALELHYNGSQKNIGLDPALRRCDRLIFTDGKVQLEEGISLHTLPMPPMDAAGLTVMENGQLRPEDFRHEQYLLIEEEGKRILFSGCSHKGILSIVQHFQPDVLIGGFHFMKIQDESLLQHAAQTLLGYPTVYYTGHCTGEMQYAILKQTMGPRLNALPGGTVFTISQANCETQP